MANATENNVYINVHINVFSKADIDQASTQHQPCNNFWKLAVTELHHYPLIKEKKTKKVQELRISLPAFPQTLKQEFDIL